MGTPVVITGWTAVSPFGLGRQAFSDGLRSGRSTVVEHVVEGSPDEQTCLVPDLDPAKILNGKGVRHLDRASQLALATLGELVEESDTGLRAGLVIGTTGGSVQSEMDHIRLSLTMSRPHFLEPKTIASGTMNCATAQCAIRFGITGPNTTLAGGRGAALHALNYAKRLLTLDRADSVIVGAVEEWTTARAWVTHHAGHRPGRPLGEGCAAFRVEPAATAKRPALAEVLGFGSRLAADPDDTAAAMTECALGVLKHADVRSWDVWAVLGPVGTDQRIPEGLFGNVISDVPDLELMGDTGAVSSAFALVAALDVLRSRPDADGRVVLVVSSDPSGVAACALLRLVADRDETRKDDDE